MSALENPRQTLDKPRQSRQNWIPQVGEQVRFVPGKAPCDVWENLDLKVIRIVDPDKGVVAVRAESWMVSQQTSPAILQPA